MGSKSSKITSSATGATRRQYPTRLPPSALNSNQHPQTVPSPSASASAKTPPPATPHPQSHRSDPAPLASDTKSPHITHDAADPHFASQLRSLGPVRDPASTLSRTSTVATSSQYPSALSAEGDGSAVRAGAEGGPVPIQRNGGAQVFPDPRNNTALRVLKARERVSREAELEVEAAGAAAAAAGRQGPDGVSAKGRKYMDAITLRRILWLRDEGGVAGAEIERRLGLRGGIVALLRGTALPDEAPVDTGAGSGGAGMENEGPSRPDTRVEVGAR